MSRPTNLYGIVEDVQIGDRRWLMADVGTLAYNRDPVTVPTKSGWLNSQVRFTDYLSKWIECLNTASLVKRLRIQGASRSRNVQAGCRSWSLLHRRDASKFLKEILYEDNFFAFVLGLRCGDSNCQSFPIWMKVEVPPGCTYQDGFF